MDKFIIWASKNLLMQIRQGGDKSLKRFMHDLIHNRDYVIKIFSQDVEALSLSYMVSPENKDCVLGLSADPGDENLYITVAKRMANHIHDILLKDEIAALEN